MSISILLFVFLCLSVWSYFLGKRRAYAVAQTPRGMRAMHSRPYYYGALTAMWCLLPALFFFIFWHLFEHAVITGIVVSELPPEMQNLQEFELNVLINDIKNLVDGDITSGEVDFVHLKAASRWRALAETSHAALTVLCLGTAVGGAIFIRSRISPKLRARNHVESVIKVFLITCSTIAIFTTIGIVISVLYEALRFFQVVSPFEFLFGLSWSPQMAIRVDQVGSTGAFGAVPVFLGTAVISFIAMLVAVPVGLMSAIYLSEYASKNVRNAAKPLLEILAGIPTVVYGFFAALTVAPAVRGFGAGLGLDVSSESALAAGLVMGIMIIPFVSSLSDDVINAVPQAMRDGAYGLGATKSETVKHVIIPAALPGIMGGILLAVSRAIGETMIVVMAAGLSANLTVNPLESLTTVTVQIVTLLVGDQEFDSPKTLAAFALGLVLFFATLVLNVVALHVVRKYREQYE